VHNYITFLLAIWNLNDTNSSCKCNKFVFYLSLFPDKRDTTTTIYIKIYPTSKDLFDADVDIGAFVAKTVVLILVKDWETSRWQPQSAPHLADLFSKAFKLIPPVAGLSGCDRRTKGLQGEHQ